jgi:phenylalanyl-tRNA synthetase beta chain
MRVPYEWLQEYCAPDMSLEEVEHLLTMSGTKVEAIHHHGVKGIENFVVGKVQTCEQHPDADRLKVCTVDVGDGTASQIVCGAPNVAAGQTVAVAKPGSIMPDGTKLKKAKLRGVESNGMILAEDEVGIGSDHAGIMELETKAKPGSPLADVLPIATDVIEFEITPNRPDCLGVYGIARELHAAAGAKLKPEPWAADLGTIGTLKSIEVKVEAPDLCPRFTARIFENVTIGPSPRWLKARLMAAGMRPINNVVDIGNYVMLLTGQPLHAFDLDNVAGAKLVIRRAKDGEAVDTLDGQTRKLDSEMVVIDDADGPTSIAGVMGGARSEVEDGTTRVLMEVATWIGHNIKRTSNKLALRSEASARFEKGLAPEQTLWAQAVATKLMIDLTGATVTRGTLDVGPYAEQPWPEPVIALREQRVNEILGMPIKPARQKQLLTALGFGTKAAAGGLDVTVPGFRRNDVSREADLIEEVARFELDQLPATLPKRRGAGGHLSPEQTLRRRAIDVLVGRGAYEAVGWSFTDPQLVDRLRLPAGDPRRAVVALQNPMSEEQSVLRTTLLGSLLDVAKLNTARAAPDLLVCEQGAVYTTSKDKLPNEHRALSALAAGQVALTDFFAMKALLGAVLDTLRVQWLVDAHSESFLHPGRSGAVVVAGDHVGWVGELHPLVAKGWDLEKIAAFEIDLDAVVKHAVAVPHYESLSDYPAVSRDVSFWIPEGLSFAPLLKTTTKAAGSLLAEARLVDSYADAKTKRVSYTLGFEFRATDRTLTDDDVDPVIAKIAQAAAKLGAEQRA